MINGLRVTLQGFLLRLGHCSCGKSATGQCNTCGNKRLWKTGLEKDTYWYPAQTNLRYLDRLDLEHARSISRSKNEPKGNLYDKVTCPESGAVHGSITLARLILQHFSIRSELDKLEPLTTRASAFCFPRWVLLP